MNRRRLAVFNQCGSNQNFLSVQEWKRSSGANLHCGRFFDARPLTRTTKLDVSCAQKTL